MDEAAIGTVFPTARQLVQAATCFFRSAGVGDAWINDTHRCHFDGPSCVIFCKGPSFWVQLGHENHICWQLRYDSLPADPAVLGSHKMWVETFGNKKEELQGIPMNPPGL